MRKLLLSLFVVIGITSALASIAQAEDYYNDANYDDALLDEYTADEFAYLINKFQMLEQTAYKLNGTQVNDKCTVFMDKSFVLGDLGKFISKEIQTYPDRYKALIYESSLSQSCPKYPKMNLQQRSVVIALLLTVMAHFESSCKIESSIKGPNGRTYGYWQLHKGQETRNVKKGSLCKKNDSTIPTASAQCTLEMLEQQVQRTNGKLFVTAVKGKPKPSYWDVLLTNGESKKAGVIGRTLQNFSLCKQLVL